MRRRLLLGALLTAMVAVFAISGTAVAGQPIGGCPPGYSLIKAKIAPAVDKNGDGWICEKAVQGGANGFNDIDNQPNR
ncbi:MAG: hypothetical protein ACXVY6_04075 [Gaiellaceae bacterium]